MTSENRRTADEAVGTSAGALFELVRSARAVTRSELALATGLSRTAVAARLDALLALGLLTAGPQVTSTGGRPSESLRVAHDAGVVVAIAIGRSRHQIGVHDLLGGELGSVSAEHEVGSPAAALMPRIVAVARDLLAATASGRTVVGIGMSLPGSVDPEEVCSVGSPVLPGWDGVPLEPFLRELGTAPVWLGNDADALAHAEILGRPELRDALVLKASTGLGLGLVADGRILRGHRGAAGELGHCRVPEAAGRACRCGATGCLETVAGGWALVADHAERHPEAGLRHVRELVDLARRGDAEARGLIRDAGRHLGPSLAFGVNLLNPEAIVVGGDLVGAFDVLAGGIRETLFPAAGELATRDLRILPSVHRERAGLVGCAALALDHALAPHAIDLRVARR
ncbi:ROK family protein [Nocardioides sp. TRM66260-LWL]|uniref:ROK family protein n=1 Tax=Nocardioides sp. TRM66260-LWL TaxID=2874478 RepID=UPI001CC786D8|nr:ROK family protein [Nocardioides sp. TRM66260-LWL]MBZ5736056.1 ROK family protein [Nocardioides sp. TRM66260-LWL]